MIYETKHINKKNIGIIVISIVVCTAGYLFYVKNERAASVKNYAPKPQVGDIYKMRQETHDDGIVVYYLKLIKIDNSTAYFFRSRMNSAVPNDVILKQFDGDRQYSYSTADLADIAAGKWMTTYKDKTEIIEIERK